jgi:UDP-N-acetylmuramyl tripeptide synthase
MDPELNDPTFGFDDSRRLTGPSRWYAGCAVTLTPLGDAAQDAAAHARWAARVNALCAALGWPAPHPRVQAHGREPMLMFAAPAGGLFTATEINEWAWERSAAEAGVTGFDLAQDVAGDAALWFAARARAEDLPALSGLQATADRRGLPVLVDDEHASIGAGTGSRTWPLATLPEVAEVPWATLHDIPAALITGSNGKTTTTRLLAAMARTAGLAAGWCCTEGVFVAGQALETGDYSGPAGARAVLRHPGVQLAVLETARGGLLRRGLAVQRAGVAVVTNIQADHLGEYGVETAEALAEVKLTVARAVQHAGGTLVLNADDAVLMAAAARLPHASAARLALFAHDFDEPALAALRQAGGRTCGARGGQLLLGHGDAAQSLGAVVALPLTLQGAARHNTANAAAAALAAAALGLPLSAIAQTLQHFGARPQDNPGRLERWAYRGATVLLDYAHNPEGLAQLLAVARALRPRRLGLLLGQAGNRDDAAMAALARTAAGFAPDLVVIKELPAMLRGRVLGEVPALLRAALGSTVAVHEEADEEAAARHLLAWAEPGDVLVLPVHTAAVRERLALALAG